MISGSRLELHTTEAKSRVTNNHDYLLVRVEVLSGNCKSKSNAHRAKSTCIQSLQRSIVLEYCAADVHRVGAFGDNDVVFTEACNLILNDTDRRVVIHWQCLILGKLLGNLSIFRRFCFNCVGPLTNIGLALGERCGGNSLVELTEDNFSVATERHNTLDIGIHLKWVTFELNYLDIFSEPRWCTKVQDPVEASSAKEDHISILEDMAAGTGS